MNLKHLLKFLQEEDLDLEVFFDVKNVESIQDFANLVNVYVDDDSIILELR